jgi:hypothetical protein
MGRNLFRNNIWPKNEIQCEYRKNYNFMRLGKKSILKKLWSPQKTIHVPVLMSDRFTISFEILPKSEEDRI